MHQLPKDILRLITQYVCGNRPRSRWGAYAVMRLVCKKFQAAIPVSMLKRVLMQDMQEFEVVCLLYGEAYEISPWNFAKEHMHYYAIMHPTKVAHAMDRRFNQCTTCKEGDVSLICVCDRVLKSQIPILIQLNCTPSHNIVKLFNALLGFRRHGGGFAGQEAWLAVSSTYHTYIRGILEGDPTWTGKVEVDQAYEKKRKLGEL